MTDTKEATRALWRKCFSDEEKFVDMYFRFRFTEERNHTLWKDGRLVSSLQLLPYPMKLFGRIIPTSYVSGVCTDIEVRNQGFMPRLLKDVHQQMAADDVYLSTLIPAEDWLMDYYARFGYATVFFYQQEMLTREEADSRIAVAVLSEEKEANLEAYAYFDRKQRERQTAVLHTEEDFQAVLEDLKLSQGKLLAAKTESRIVGLAFCYLVDGQVQIQEFFADSEEVRFALFANAFQYFPVSELIYFELTKGNKIPLGMARIVNVEKILQLYAEYYPCCKLSVEVVDDDFIPSNNGFYTVSGGHCIKQRLPHLSYQRVNIGQLTEIILLPENPYMALMLN